MKSISGQARGGGAGEADDSTPARKMIEVSVQRAYINQNSESTSKPDSVNNEYVGFTRIQMIKNAKKNSTTLDKSNSYRHRKVTLKNNSHLTAATITTIGRKNEEAESQK